jgi:hypothetical protein
MQSCPGFIYARTTAQEKAAGPPSRVRELGYPPQNFLAMSIDFDISIIKLKVGVWSAKSSGHFPSRDGKQRHGSE